MALVRIAGREVDVDIEKELSEFTWYKARWSAEKLIACSPFRYDNKPSFYVYLENTATAKAGSWGDSGGIGEYQRGGLVKLLSFLRNETPQETVEYLLSRYASYYVDDVSSLELDLDWLDKARERKKKPTALNGAILEKFDHECDYLSKRGISRAVQRLMRTGYDPERNCVTIPYFLTDSRLANIKYRRVDSKIFFYEKGGMPIRELLYGINVIHDRNVKKAVLTEAEIDAMYIMSAAKTAAIAVGTSKLSDEKADLIKRSPIEELIVFPDNDEAGRELIRQAREKLIPHVRLYVVEYPRKYKDPNEIKDAELLREYLKTATFVAPTFFE